MSDVGWWRALSCWVGDGECVAPVCCASLTDRISLICGFSHLGDDLAGVAGVAGLAGWRGGMEWRGEVPSSAQVDRAGGPDGFNLLALSRVVLKALVANDVGLLKHRVI